MKKFCNAGCVSHNNTHACLIRLGVDNTLTNRARTIKTTRFGNKIQERNL